MSNQINFKNGQHPSSSSFESQIKQSSFKHVRNYFREYCSSTTIHGMKYFGEKRTIIERVWWFCIFIICVAGCGYSIYTVYVKWEQSPVIVSFATKGTPIYDIPFPAVTICATMKFRKNTLYYSDLLKKDESENSTLSDEEKINLNHAALLCNTGYFESMKNSSKLTYADDCIDTFENHKIPFDLLQCKFMGQIIDNCEKAFTPILTDEGICYTFNMMDRSEIFQDSVIHFQNYSKTNHEPTSWSLEEMKYDINAGVESYPKRALLAGASNGLSIFISPLENDFDYLCYPIPEYRVVLHIPTRIPRPSQDFFRLPLNMDVVASIQPTMITTSESVKLYNPTRRECFFSSESKLKYFKIYTSLNCKMECLTNVTLEMCDCVQFFMPRENGTRICGMGKEDCMKNAENAMNDLLLKNLIINNQTNKKPSQTCRCLPLCTDLTYEVETSQNLWEWQKIFNSTRDSTELEHMSSLTVYFKSDNFIKSQRNELYGPTDFLANFGGVLGLFTGFSILSLMEIFYYLTLRIYCNIRLYGLWSGPSNE